MKNRLLRGAHLLIHEQSWSASKAKRSWDGQDKEIGWRKSGAIWAQDKWMKVSR